MMYNSSSTLHCVMDNDVFNSPLEMTDRNPMLMDAITSNVFSSSFVLPEAPDLNSQTQIMTGYPSVSTVREVINDLHISNHTEGIDSDEPVSRYSSIMGGASFSTTAIATLLATRSSLNENFNGVSLSATSALLFEDNTLNSSISASVNREYDGDMEYLEANEDGNIIGQLQSKWDPYRCIGSSDPDSWISSENSSASLDHPYNYCMPSKDLSLSLATSQPSGVNQHSLTLGFGSHEPFHFSHIFSGTKYLHAVQKILAEIARYSLENFDQWSYSPKGIAGVEKISCSSSSSAEREVSMMNSDELPFSTGETGDGQMKLTLQREEVEAKKAQLLALLQVVDSRYNQCLDEIHTVISAFHAVSELDPQTHTRFALQTISLLYQNLRERITNQILMIGERLNGVFLKEKDRSFESSFIQKQWDLQQPRRKDLQSWKPQRGLPERSVSVLRAWMFQNFLHPYPKDSEKHILAIRSGLTRSQVSNWFINARVRLWKPMIEEMYSEMNNRKGRRIEGTDSDHRSRLRFDNQIMRMN